MRRDSRLLFLGETLAALSETLGADDLDELERIELLEQWSGTLDAMTRVAATARGGLRVKAGAILIFAARTGDIHKELTLSLVSDLLGSAR
jgi:hypothetical protein